MKERDLEVVELRRRIARLTEEARKNEDAWQRSQRREMALLDAGDLPALLTQLTDGLRRSYRLQATSVALADPHHEIRHLLGALGVEPQGLSRVLFVDSVSQAVAQLRARKRPWLGPFVPADHDRLLGGGRGLASVALLPLMRHGRAVGSVHFGSSDARRFTGEHATDFLDHLGIIAAFSLENAINRARLVRSGFTDPLTGWHNRRYLQIRLQEEIARSQREETSLVCLMLDVDHFKRVNDSYGHSIGDEVLRTVAQRIAAQVRSSDVSARYGGEEFIVLLPHTQLDTGRLLAERIRAAVAAQPFGIEMLDEPLPVTVSIGLAEYRPSVDPDDAVVAGERLISAADAALYDAKAAGRNAVSLAAGKRVAQGRR